MKSFSIDPEPLTPYDHWSNASGASLRSIDDSKQPEPMSIEVTNRTNNSVAIKISGQLGAPDLGMFQQAVLSLVPGDKKWRVLLNLEDFMGWGGGEEWADLTVQLKFDPIIERMAIVGDPKWAESTTLFVGKGFRTFPIEYFGLGERARAEAWIEE